MINKPEALNPRQDKIPQAGTGIGSMAKKPVLAPVDTVAGAQVSVDSDEAEIMRRASIEYVHLHIKPETKSGDNLVSFEEQANPENEEMSVSCMSVADLADYEPAPRVVTMTEGDKVASLGLVDDRGIDVGPFEKHLQRELGPHATIQNDWDIDRIGGEIPSLSRLTEHFREIAGDPDIPWEHLPDGCYARAHEACGKILDQGMNSAKIYVMIGDLDSNFFSFPKWRLKAQNKFTKGEWWYHVAALTFAKDDKTGKVDGYVLDAAVNPDRPIKADEWIRHFWSQDFPINFDITHPDIYDPPEQTYIDYKPREFSRKKFDKHLKVARKTNHEYCRVLQQIKNRYYGHNPSEMPQGWKTGGCS